MSQKLYFLTFGAGGTDYYDAVERLCGQAADFGCFTKIIKITDKDLEKDTEFWEKHKDLLQIIKEDLDIGYGSHILFIKHC